MYYCEIAPNRIVRKGQDSFTYESSVIIPIGSVLRISIGKTSALGIVLSHVKKPTYVTKAIDPDLIITHIPEALVRTAKWISIYYSTPFAHVLQTLLPSGLEKKRRSSSLTEKTRRIERTHIVLNSSQRAALTRIQKQDKTALLFGATGSGKTVVYSELAKQSLAVGRSAIILTPEIALTPQLVTTFKEQFSRVIVTHSGMSEAERHKVWQSVQEHTEPLIIIGPRSALFLPVKNIGCIIIDEAHEPTYKQEQAPKYDTLRVARVLATEHHAKLILGSATPSVEDYYRAGKNEGIVTMPHKIANNPPQIEIVDLTDKTQRSGDGIFSKVLLEKMEETLARDEQVLLFHNRRGSAGLVMCENCGWQALCTVCFTPLVFHADEHILRCHLCGKNEQTPPSCPVCRHADIVYKGVGTKRVETLAHTHFPKASIMRFDGDTVEKEKFHHHYDAIVDNKVQIIIGTQQLAKGLNLPRLGLVGIMQADTGLLMPDFTAHERVFQLLSQVAGRAGRQAHQTTVVVQTYQASNPLIIHAINEEYEAFYEQEIKNRLQQNLPPFTHTLQLIVTYKTEMPAVKAAKELAGVLKKDTRLQVLGPTPAFYERLRGSYRWQLIIKSKDRELLQAIVPTINPHWQAELDPKSFLA
jgi:primosomal protein N' (replication factor Y)